jgi:hypothetical protein
MRSRRPRSRKKINYSTDILQKIKHKKLNTKISNILLRKYSTEILQNRKFKLVRQLHYCFYTISITPFLGEKN